MSPKTETPARRYHFFILGLWLQPGQRPGDPVDWRIVLEDPRTSERRGFKDVAELTAFLNQWMADPFALIKHEPS